MVYRYLADLVVLLHTGFVLFVVLGGFLVLWKPIIAWFHVPAVFWAAGIELYGRVCPLTPLENMLRARGDAAGYATGFIEHYIMPVLYPEVLTRKIQIALGMTVLSVNVIIYLILWCRIRKTGADQK